MLKCKHYSYKWEKVLTKLVEIIRNCLIPRKKKSRERVGSRSVSQKFYCLWLLPCRGLSIHSLKMIAASKSLLYCVHPKEGGTSLSPLEYKHFPLLSLGYPKSCDCLQANKSYHGNAMHELSYSWVLTQSLSEGEWEHHVWPRIIGIHLWSDSRVVTWTHLKFCKKVEMGNHVCWVLLEKCG